MRHFDNTPDSWKNPGTTTRPYTLTRIIWRPDSIMSSKKDLIPLFVGNYFSIIMLKKQAVKYE